MRENQKLKKLNANLIKICKKRSKSANETDRENEDPVGQDWLDDVILPSWYLKVVLNMTPVMNRSFVAGILSFWYCSHCKL